MPSSILSTAEYDLDIRAVSKHYHQHGREFTAVDNLSLQIPKGSFCSILGPSGCGKTTLLRMIAGFITPDDGDIFIAGKSMRNMAANRRPVNMVFQHLALFPMMSVGENVAYGLARRGESKNHIQHKVADMLRRVGLPDTQGKRIDQLSGGQKQRVAIARSLVLEPALLLLDEPLGALDLKLREHMKVELKQLQAEIGTTFVYITHDQSEALVMSDLVAVMNGGRFEQIGTPQDLYYRPQSAFVAGFVGNSNHLQASLQVEDAQHHYAITPDALKLNLHACAARAHGEPLELYIRPESIALARHSEELVHFDNQLSGTVQSLLFDGANSTVLVNVRNSQLALHVALPHTGQFSDLERGESVALGIQAQHIQAFAV